MHSDFYIVCNVQSFLALVDLVHGLKLFKCGEKVCGTFIIVLY